MAEPTASKKTYKDTLNLPKTAFAMKANLVQSEPASLKRWQKMNLYQRVLDARKTSGGRTFVFHDGPPYANGSIHLGHLLNKVLKDLAVRSRLMLGYHCPYVPGWDCHGLPIEHKVVQDLGPAAREMPPIQIRRKCRASAEKFVKLQSQQVQRLLTLADYREPYLTMDPAYEAGVLEVFAGLVEKGLVYRGLKPVHWSIENRTALAEAELEYYGREDTSAYVLFEITNKDQAISSAGFFSGQIPDDEPVYLMIWTTTPWTLPANLAVVVNERAVYGLYRFQWDGKDRYAFLAQELAEKIFQRAGVNDFAQLGGIVGREFDLHRVAYRHPFLNDNRARGVYLADYVTLEDGTGLVHTAPGHGTEDYQTGLREGLDIYCPVQADGTFDSTAPDWLRGKSVWEANGLVIAKLRESGRLFHAEAFTHSYPHDWRGKTPVIFRATEQWFVNVDQPFDHGGSLRERALTAVTSAIRHPPSAIAFFPDWGRNRMRGMIESRPDWCLSRQRAWGLPIPAFYPPEGVAGPSLLTPASIRAVARTFRENGSDSWFLAPAEDLLQYYSAADDPDAPDWIKSPNHQITKSPDTFDVWFESGSSWHAALQQRDLGYPADLYLEGSDQHRGWFQHSLLPALAVTGKPPFRAVLTHGFMVDKGGKKMSKSLGNTLEVEQLLKNYGADVCRWWVCSLNTDNDIKVDESYFKVAGEEYRKVRNTIRFLLSNLVDFDPTKDAYALDHDFCTPDALSLDAWALLECSELVKGVTKAYNQYAFPVAHKVLFDFCNDTLSAVYLAAGKDRLYCDAPGSPRRRRMQTALYRIASSLIRLLAPILPHTAEEAWRALHPQLSGDASVHLETLPLPGDVGVACDPRWLRVMRLRDDWLKTVEDFRQKQGVDNPLDLGVFAGDDGQLDEFDTRDMADLLGVSRFVFEGSDAANMRVVDLRSEPRCERSWKRDGTVKHRCDGGMLSDRDAAAVGVS